MSEPEPFRVGQRLKLWFPDHGEPSAWTVIRLEHRWISGLVVVLEPWPAGRCLLSLSEATVQKYLVKEKP